jgi:hypothetical protein
MSDVNQLLQPFKAMDGYAVNSTVAVATTAASQQVTLPTPNQTMGAFGVAAQPVSEFQVDVLNAGATPLFVSICFGTNPTAVIPTGTPGAYTMGPNERRTFTVPANTTKAAIISTGTTGVVYISVGNGRA